MSNNANPQCAPAWQKTRERISQDNRISRTRMALERARQKEQEAGQRTKWRQWLEWVHR